MKPYLTALVFAGCLAKQDMPVEPPPDRHQRLEGLKALTRELHECLPDHRVAVTAEVVDAKTLSFRLTNISDRTFQLYDFNLPWGNSNAIQVAAVTASGEIVPTGWPIDDPGPAKTVSMSPGQTLLGKAALSSKLDDLEPYLKRTDVLILWSYRFISVGDEHRGGCASGVAIATRRIAPNSALQKDGVRFASAPP